MKITTNQLRQIIKEEISRVLAEAPQASAIPASYLEFRNLVSNLVNDNGAPGLAYALASEETPAIEVGWMGYEDKAAYLQDDGAKLKALADAAYKSVMTGARKYKADEGESFIASEIATVVKDEILAMSPSDMAMLKVKLNLA